MLSNAPALDQRFDRAPVDDALVHAAAKIEQVLERAFLARFDDVADGRLAGALDRAQSIATVCSSTGENT